MVFRVLDATAFYAGLPFRSHDRYHITDIVYNEIQHIKKNHDAIQILIDTKRLLIQQPNHIHVKKAKDTAEKTGDLTSLSNEDISSIALSLELEAELLTDDFAVSNVARNLGIEVIPIMTKGIKTVGRWIHYCSACGISSKKLTCANCGNKLTKKLITEN